MGPDTSLGYWKGLNPALAKKIQFVSRRLDIDADYMAAVIAFETGRTFSPRARNPVSGATGLIQFIRPTARAMGTTTDELALMSDIQQMKYVERHFKATKPNNNIQSVYASVLAPKWRYDPPDTPMYRAPSKAYVQNKPLDWNNDGAITVEEAARPVTQMVAQARKRAGHVPALTGEDVEPFAVTSAAAPAGLGILALVMLGVAAATRKRKR